MRKRVFSMTAVVLLAMALFLQTPTARAIRGRPELTISGTTATCSVKLESGNSGDVLDVTLTLWCGESIVNSWSKSGAGSVSISERCSVVRYNTYELVLTYRVNGVLKPQVSVTADS